MHRRDRRELFSPRGLRAYQDGNDHSDWISGRTVDRAVILCAAEECGGVLLHRATSRFANFSSAGRPGRICPQGHCVPAHRRPVRSIGRPPRSSGSSNFGSALTSRPGPMGLPRKPRAVTVQSGHGRCCGVRYVPAHRRPVQKTSVVRIGVGSRLLPNVPAEARARPQRCIRLTSPMIRLLVGICQHRRPVITGYS